MNPLLYLFCCCIPASPKPIVLEPKTRPNSPVAISRTITTGHIADTYNHKTNPIDIVKSLPNTSTDQEFIDWYSSFSSKSKK